MKMSLIFGHVLSTQAHECVQVAEICAVDLTFTVRLLSVCNLTDQRTEAHQCALDGKYSR